MIQVGERRLTFEEFATRKRGGRFELVDGRMEALVSPSPLHGWTFMEFTTDLVNHLRSHDPNGYWGSEVEIPTTQFHGRRPDFIYISAEDVAGNLDRKANRVYGVPSLVLEVVSDDDRNRDLVDKRKEYAEIGIRHYWILDPEHRQVLLLALKDGQYEVVAEFSEAQTLTSPSFPGLEIPLARLFRW